MAASRWPEPFADDAWFFEMKWDGVRALLHWDGHRVTLRSRSGKDATERYADLGTFAAAAPVVLDGEIVSLDDAGRPSFERLQQRMNLQSPSLVAEAVSRVPISYVVFDVLHETNSIIGLPIEERLDRLTGMELPHPMVRSQVVPGDPGALWSFVKERGIEGVVTKRLGSVYRPGQRSPDWRKITAFRRLRAVVGGFTVGEGSRLGAFGALLLGLWDADKLRWIDSVGSGFSDEALRAIRSALDVVTIDDPPFMEVPVAPGRVTWVEPQLVAMVQYKEWTSVGRLRAPSFKGFTDDDLASVTWEAEGPDAPG